MSNQQIPSDAPPSYDEVAGGSSSRPAASHLSVPGASNNQIPPEQRRSMEDLVRELPRGWVRSYDPSTNHQFFVNTTTTPPQSQWHHPYDDEVFLATLSSEERERLEQESMHRGENPSKADIMAAHSDDEETHHTARPGASTSVPSELPPRPSKNGKEASGDTRSFGRKFKDKVTGSTHEQREAERKRRDEEERKMYEQHMKIRNAMSEAARTGQPVKVGRDSTGRDVFVEPPPRMMGGGMMGGGMMGGGYGPYSGGGYGYNPYGSSGMYAPPSAQYMRPAGPYGRPPMGRGGMGMPLGLGIGGGLLGGLLLGDMMF